MKMNILRKESLRHERVQCVVPYCAPKIANCNAPNAVVTKTQLYTYSGLVRAARDDGIYCDMSGMLLFCILF